MRTLCMCWWVCENVRVKKEIFTTWEKQSCVAANDKRERKKEKEKKDAAKTTFLMTFDEEIELKNQNEMTSRMTHF